MDGFITASNQSKQAVIKKALPLIGIVFGAIAILGILLIPPMVSRGLECEETSQNTGITRCENKFKKIIFVVGDTANTPRPKLSDDFANLITYMYDGSESGFSYVSVSDPDATPKPIRIKKLKNAKEEIINQLSQSSAEKDGADYLEAIRNAASFAGNKGDTLIYVIGSGLSDSGLLNFADDNLLIDHNVDEIEKSLNLGSTEKAELSELTIVWDGMGITAEPQKELNKALRDKEESIYSAVLGRFGLNLSDFIIVHESSDVEENEVETYVAPTLVKNESLVLEYPSDGDSKLAFIPGESNFVDRERAKKEIEKIANNYHGYSFTVKAYASRGRCDWEADQNLLRGRAEATKNLLIEVGIPEDNILIEDGEIGDANECPNGFGNYPVDENEAPKNRKVVIMPTKK